MVYRFKSGDFAGFSSASFSCEALGFSRLLVAEGSSAAG